MFGKRKPKFVVRTRGKNVRAMPYPRYSVRVSMLKRERMYSHSVVIDSASVTTSNEKDAKWAFELLKDGILKKVKKK